MLKTKFIYRFIVVTVFLFTIQSINAKESSDSVTALNSAILEGNTFSFFIENPKDILTAVHGGHLALPLMPPGMQALEEKNLEPALILSTKVRDETGLVIGTATQMEYFNAIEKEDKTLTHTTWTVQIPHSGTLFLYTNEYITLEFKKILKEVKDKKEVWEGNIDTQTSAGPLPNGHGIIVGGTGIFAGIKGEFIERNIFNKYTDDLKLHGQMELRLMFDK